MFETHPCFDFRRGPDVDGRKARWAVSRNASLPECSPPPHCPPPPVSTISQGSDGACWGSFEAGEAPPCC